MCPYRNGCGYGDGRAISMAELRTQSGQRWELQLKGAGTTPFCRGADGRAVLRSSIREFIASEAMNALGVPTTRALSLVVSGKMKVNRPHPTGFGRQYERCAITCRVAPSLLRVGSFEVFGKRICDAADQFPQARDQLAQLVHHAVHREFGGPDQPDDSPGVMAVKLLFAAAERIATTTAEWLRVGFCMGNFQSDNCLVSGSTMDYGPFSWMEAYDPNYASWNGDSQGHFAFGKQMEAGGHNVESLVRALAPLIDHMNHDELLEAIKSKYWSVALGHKDEIFRRKLGLATWGDEAPQLLDDLLGLMNSTHADYTITFRQLADLVEADADCVGLLQLLRLPALPESAVAAWTQWLKRWSALVHSQGRDSASIAASIRHTSPKYVPREWILIEVYTAAERGEYGPAQEVLSLLTKPYAEQPEMAAKYYRSVDVEPMS